jgi:hypothetical protein
MASIAPPSASQARVSGPGCSTRTAPQLGQRKAAGALRAELVVI